MLYSYFFSASVWKDGSTILKLNNVIQFKKPILTGEDYKVANEAILNSISGDIKPIIPEENWGDIFISIDTMNFLHESEDGAE